VGGGWWWWGGVGVGGGWGLEQIIIVVRRTKLSVRSVNNEASPLGEEAVEVSLRCKCEYCVWNFREWVIVVVGRVGGVVVSIQRDARALGEKTVDVGSAVTGNKRQIILRAGGSNSVGGGRQMRLESATTRQACV